MDISSGVQDNENSCNFSNFNPFIIILKLDLKSKHETKICKIGYIYRFTNTNISQQP